MTPKEKASELVEKFRRYTPAGEDLEYEYSKQCAIIAVDEILNNDGFTQFDQYLTEFWNEVKTEINNL